MAKFDYRNRVAIVVEDDLLQRMMLADLLEEQELMVVQCLSAEAAECVLSERGNEVSVIVTDVELAGEETGVELALHAIEQFPALRVVVVSANERPALPRQVTFLSKPYQPLELMRAVIP